VYGGSEAEILTEGHKPEMSEQSPTLKTESIRLDCETGFGTYSLSRGSLDHQVQAGEYVRGQAFTGGADRGKKGKIIARQWGTQGG